MANRVRPRSCRSRRHPSKHLPHGSRPETRRPAWVTPVDWYRSLWTMGFLQSTRQGTLWAVAVAFYSSLEDHDTRLREGEVIQTHGPAIAGTVNVLMLDRAQKHGMGVLVVIFDVWALHWRPRDLDNVYVPLLLGIGNQIGFTHPVSQAKYRARSGKGGRVNITAALMA